MTKPTSTNSEMSSGTLTVTEQLEGDLLIMRLAGRADSTNAEFLAKRLTAFEEGGLMDEARGIIVDLTELFFITSAGLRSLLIAQREASNNKREFAIAGVRSELSDIFSLTGFNRLIRIFDRTEEAVGSMGQRG